MNPVTNIPNISETIPRLHEIASSGRKLGLFIGRTPYEPLPDEGDGIVWVSLDISTANYHGDPAATISKERIHLQINFNDYSQLRKIQRLFDKVVLDRAVYKFFSGSFKEDDLIIQQLVNLLNPKGDGVLIFDNSTGTEKSSVYDHKRVVHLLGYLREQRGTVECPSLDNLKTEKEYVINRLKADFTWNWRATQLRIKSHLQAFFKDVSYKIYSAYPYKTRMCNGKGNDSDYFIAKGLKESALPEPGLIASITVLLTRYPSL